MSTTAFSGWNTFTQRIRQEHFDLLEAPRVSTRRCRQADGRNPFSVRGEHLLVSRSPPYTCITPVPSLILA